MRTTRKAGRKAEGAGKGGPNTDVRPRARRGEVGAEARKVEPRSSGKTTANDIKRLIAISNLGEAALTEIMLQCTATLGKKRAKKLELKGLLGPCHTAPDRNMRVSVWENKVFQYECSLEEAEAAGIAPCG